MGKTSTGRNCNIEYSKPKMTQNQGRVSNVQATCLVWVARKADAGKERDTGIT